MKQTERRAKAGLSGDCMAYQLEYIRTQCFVLKTDEPQNRYSFLVQTVVSAAKPVRKDTDRHRGNVNFEYVERYD